MAETSKMIHAHDKALRYQHAMLDELHDVVREWNELNENEWLTWMADWDQFALSNMRKLHEYAEDGQFSARQMAEYQRLIQRIEENRGLIQQYGLTMPRIPITR